MRGEVGGAGEGLVVGGTVGRRVSCGREAWMGGGGGTFRIWRRGSHLGPWRWRRR